MAVRAVLTGTLVVLTVVLVAAFFVRDLSAQTVIKDRDHLIKWLKEKHGESRRILSRAGSGHVIEIFVSRKRTWTVVVTTPGGLTLLTSAGDSWQEFELPTIRTEGSSFGPVNSGRRYHSD